MVNTKLNILDIAFWVLVLADVSGILFNITLLHQVAKPLLMPALMLHLWNCKTNEKGKNVILTGLFFSWCGDVFLLFESATATFFIFGLVSFLITHICYILYFLSIKSISPSLLKKQPFLSLLVFLYGFSLVWLLLPYLGELKIPVIVYAAVICSMLICSFHIYFKINKPANRFFVIGAALFVLSDSLLALNKFYHPLPAAGLWIMGSYCAAQYFIVSGFIKNI